jgi:hypothetical protein
LFAEYRALGIRTIPLKLNKKPLVRWMRVTLDDHFEKSHPNAQIGAVCGDVITIVDVDDRAFLGHALERFGHTPLQSRTRKGFHLWYRASGERRLLRPFGKHVPIDVLGSGGYAVVPNSEGYAFIAGSLADVPHLPAIPSDVLPCSSSPERESVQKGTRNRSLFTEALRLAAHVEHLSSLEGRLHDINATYEPPLPRSEVQSILRSVWRYKAEDSLLVRGQPAILMRRTDHEALMRDSDAYVLLMDLKNNHRLREGQFYLGNATRLRFGWTIQRFNRAWQTLEGLRFIRITHRGGNGPHDVRRAIWA